MQCLLQMAEQNPNLYLIVGDVGFSVIEPFQKKFPNRYINAGIAEQNMIGMAAGLAMAGKNVYVYSIIPFVTMRCFEQIRIDLCSQQLPVKLIGVGGGLSYGPSGITHHAIEDIAIMRALPEMTVIAPGSKFEAQQITPKLNTVKGPLYLRLSNSENSVIYPENIEIKIGKAVEVIPHDEFLIIATGNAVDLGFSVQKYLENIGIHVGFVSMPTIKPIDSAYFEAKKQTLKAIFTIEEHNVIGGLGEALARMICENFEQKIIFKAFGINDFYFHEVGTRAYLNKKAGLSVEKIGNEIAEKLIHNKLAKKSTYRNSQKLTKLTNENSNRGTALRLRA